MSSSNSHVLLIVAPYDSGVRGERMGAGPTALAPDAARLLRDSGHRVAERRIDLPGWHAELTAAFDLHRAVATTVAAREHDAFPLLLSGNCNTNLGVLAGGARDGERQGLIWLDAHGDFNTPETDATGFLDGQGLSLLLGRAWQAATADVPGFVPIPEERVLLVGARSFGEAEERALAKSTVTRLPPQELHEDGRMRSALAELAAQVDAVHLHIDLDVHDPSTGIANAWSTPGGLSEADVERFLVAVAEQVPVRSASVASYDPASDADGRMRAVALRHIERLAAFAS
jgi:arginase